tara:strand:- start:115 stop:297 length:183 start_codon:yes stop_codon:yes gene_type:complete
LNLWVLVLIQDNRQDVISNQIESQLDGQLTAFGISGKRAWSELFMSHPPLEKRIAALQKR